jgi:hypothetical protein
MVIDVTGTWSADRDVYDNYTSGTDGTIVLQRRDPDLVTPIWITVDRVDRADASNFDFRDAVNEMVDILTVIEPDPGLPPGQWIPPLPGDPYPGLDIGLVSEGFNHWVQWVRFTRAWGVDVNRDYVYGENERNPRFVYADGIVSKPTGSNIFDGTYVTGTNGCKYQFANGVDPDLALPSGVG